MWFYKALAHLPLRVLYLLSRVLFFLLFRVFRYRRDVVTSNLRHAFPDMVELDRSKLAADYYRQLADVVIEIIHAWVMPPSEFLKRVKLLNPEVLKRYREQSQTVILLTVHQCNWEWMLHAISLQTEIPIDAIYKPLHNVSVDRFIYAIRTRFGANPLAVRTSTRQILRRRHDGRIFAMVADQSPTRRERSYWQDFFNRPAAFYVGAETLARLGKQPVLFAQMKRTRRGYYEVRFDVLVESPEQTDEGDVTRAYINAAERAILAQPESWLWSNRRWKRKPSPASENSEQTQASSSQPNPSA